MQQPRKELDVSETNMALVGSEIEKKVKMAAARLEPSWATAGRKEGVVVWRIEKFNVVAQPTAEFGTFYDGDSYIILHTKNNNAGGLAWDIYFWLGRFTSIDEAGTCAYKTVELDDLLGGEPVQHRIVQGRETDPFLTLFPKSSLTILNGGVDSGFKMAAKVAGKTQLFHVSGPTMKTVRVTQCTAVSGAALCEADCYVLIIAESNIFVFQGKNASPGEATKASQFAATMEELCPTSKVAVVRTEDAPPAFWEALGGKVPVPLLPSEGTDAVVATTTPTILKSLRLFHVKDGGTFELVAEGPKVKGFKLNGADCYVLADTLGNATVWVGQGASVSEKKDAMSRAQGLLTVDGNVNGGLCRVVQGKETPEFVSAVMA